MEFDFAVDTAELWPVEYPTLIRVGRKRDGGYVVPLDAVRSARTLLSFGISTDWSFEKEFRRLNPRINILAFDHTIGARTFLGLGVRNLFGAMSNAITFKWASLRMNLEGFSTAVEYVSFFKKKIQHRRQRLWYTNDRNSVTFNDVIRFLEPDRRRSIFVKIDIEGSEYRVIPDLLTHSDSILCIAAEFHDLDICAPLFNRYMQELKQFFDIVHVHGNNYSDLNPLNRFPLSIELTLVNKKVLAGEKKPSTLTYPVPELDFPNDPTVPDFELDFGFRSEQNL